MMDRNQKPEAKEFPLKVAGIDWQRLNKGDRISAALIEEAYLILFPNRSETELSFRQLAVKEWLEKARESIGMPLVFRQQNGDLLVLTDEQAVGYLNSQATAGMRKHRNNTRRMFTHIDTEQLGQHSNDQLERNQARHALIAAAAEGARKQSVNLLKVGAKLPKLMPPDA